MTTLKLKNSQLKTINDVIENELYRLESVMESANREDFKEYLSQMNKIISLSESIKQQGATHE